MTAMWMVFRSQSHGDNLLKLLCVTTYSLYTKNSLCEKHQNRGAQTPQQGNHMASCALPSADVFHVLKQPGCNKKLTQRNATKHRCALCCGKCLPGSRTKCTLRLSKMLDACWPCATVTSPTVCWAMLYSASTRKDRTGPCWWSGSMILVLRHRAPILRNIHEVRATLPCLTGQF